LVISYDFKKEEKMARTCNEKDKKNLRKIFCGPQNQIVFDSPSAKDVPKCLSREEILKTFENCKYIAII
jgi:hypothetical protein